jgi:hypothetical protein
MSPFIRNLLILAGVALIVLVLNLEVALITIGVLLRVAFVLAVAVYLFWRDIGRREMSTWPTRAQGVVYGAAALLLVDLGWLFLGGLSGVDALAFILVAAACIFAGWRTWRDQRTYL